MSTARKKTAGKSKAKSKTGPKRGAGSKSKDQGKALKPDQRLRKTVVGLIRQKVEQKLEEKIERASLADYIRLVQLEKELQNTEAKETKATWVDPRKAEATKVSEESDSGK
jgi:hypothetical protein